MSDLEQRDLTPTGRRAEVRVFLERSAEVLRAGGGPTYNLDTEFAKTKKNRSLLVPLIVLGVIVVVALAAWAITAAIDSQTRRVSVEITAFDDLNLKDLLDVAKRNIADLENALLEADAMDKELATGLEGIAMEKASTRRVNAALGLSADELAAKNRESDAQYAVKEQALRQRLDPAIQAKRSQISDLQVKIAAYDQRGLDQARKQQEALDNKDRVFDIEKKKLTDYYEAQIVKLENTMAAERKEADARVQRTTAALTDRYTKEIAALNARYAKELADTVALYNPAWNDTAATGINAVAARSASVPVLPTPGGLPAEYPLSPVAHDDFRSAFATQRAALERLRGVPYINAVPNYLVASETAGGEMASGYVRLLDASAAAIRDRNNRLAARDDSIRTLGADLANANAERGRLEYGLAYLSRRDGDAGYIIDPRDARNIVVFLDPMYKDIAAVHAWVFRQDDAPVAELVLRRVRNEVLGTLVYMEENMTILPFDRILIGTAGEAVQ